MTSLFDSTSGLIAGGVPFWLDVSFKALIVLTLAFGITSALRSASASVRHHVWSLAFVAVLALPILTFTLPELRVSVPGWGEAEPAAAVTAYPVSAEAASVGVEGAADARLAPSATTPSAQVVDATSTVPLGERLVDLGLLVWILGVGALLARLAVGIGSAWWISRTATPLEDEAWTGLVRDVATEFSITTPVRVVSTPKLTSPMAWGLLRPALLMPEEAHDWSADRRRAVVLHEMAHVRRRDCLIHVLAEAVRAVHWLNPLAWVGARRLRSERERACDDLVLEAGTASADYAKLLLDVARFRSSRRLTWATVSMARPNELEGRLLAILDPALNRSGMSRPATVATIGLVLGVLLPLAALQVRSKEAPKVFEYAAAEVADVSVKQRVAESVRVRVRQEVEARQEADPQEARAIQALIRALGNDDEGIRSQAAHGLGMAESPLAVEALARVLADDPSADVRSNAAWALGMIEDDRAVPVLNDAIGDADANVREQSAWALGMIESADGVPGLVAALRDASAGLRSQAAWALGMIESPEAVDALIDRLRSDDSADVRSQAAWALGMIEDKSALDALVDAIEDQDEDVAEQAMWALSQVMG